MNNLSQETLKNLPTNFLIELIKIIKSEISSRKKSISIDKRREFIKSLKLKAIDNFRDEFVKYNSQLLSLHNINEPVGCRTAYLEPLIKQDWSHIYPYDNHRGDYYVYAHVDPSDKIIIAPGTDIENMGGTPFYIGKGTGNRAYDLKRNQGHGKKINQLLKSGWEKDDIVKILFRGLNENKAFELESKLIYFFGTIYQEDRKNCCLLNLEVPKIPKFKGQMIKKIIRREYENFLD